MNQFVYEINNGNYDSTLVENIFINEYMPGADGDYVKVYLYCLMESRRPKPHHLSLEELGKTLLLSSQEIMDAIHYWERLGIMSIDGTGQNQTITCHNIIEVYAGKNNNDQFSGADTYETDDAINQILFHVEKMLKTPPPFSYTQAFQEWLTDYKFEPDTIVLLVEYGLENMSGSPTSSAVLKYIKKVASDWYEHGIRTRAEAQDYLKKNRYENQLMYRVIKSLGIYNRGPMEHERKVMRSWFDNLHFEETMILEAVSRSRVSDVNYVDGILKRWFKNGWKSPSDIVDTVPAKKQSGPSQAPASTATKERIEAVEKAESDFFDIYGDEIAELEALKKQESGANS